MGVLVTGAWPMSQPIPSGSAGSSSGNSSCVVLRNTPTTTYEYDNYASAREIRERPLSVPSSCALAAQHKSCCCDPVLLNDQFSCQCSSPPSLKPSYRRSQNPNIHPRPPTCVSWLKKANVIKKIQRKMRIGLRGGGISPNNMPPLLFHSVHGDNIRISNDGTVAKRMSSFCKAIAFSDRPVKVKEKVLIRFAEVSNNWKGAVRFGFTNKDPNLFRGGLPKYAYPDLTSKPGFWAKALEDVFVKKGAILSYYVNSAGDIQFGINGEERGLFLSGVDTRRPLWALLDVYGNTTAIELVDPRAQLNNSKKNVNEPTYSSGEEVEMTLMSSMSSMNLRSCPDRVSQRYYSAAQLRSIHESLALRNKGNSSCRSPSYEYESLGSIFPTSDSSMFRQQNFSKSQSHLPKPPAPGPRNLAEFGRSHAKSSTNVSSIYQAPPTHSQQQQRNSNTQIPQQPKPQPPLPLPPKTYSCLPIVAREAVAVVRSTSNYTNPSQMKLNVSPAPSGKPSHTSTPLQMPMTTAISQQEAYKRKSSVIFTSSNVQGTSSPIYSTPYVKDIGEISNYSVECVACCERPVDSVFYACGHMCMCFQCATEYWKTKEKGACPICRASISDVIRTYKS